MTDKKQLSDEWKAPNDCLRCQGNEDLVKIIDRFSHTEYGHGLCKKCGITIDSNVNELLNISVTPEEVQNINTEEQYRDLFVETSKINNDEGEVYTDFDWHDNNALKSGVAKHIISKIGEYTDDRAGLKILDLGCGNGFTSVELAGKYGKENIVGVDPSPEILATGNKYGIKVFQGTLDGLRFTAGSFDVIVIIGNLMLHNNPGKTLAEAAKILSPNGIIILDFKNTRTTIRLLLAYAARMGISSLLPKQLVERALVNMRYGFNKKYIRGICTSLNLRELDSYSKPPRLLEFDNNAGLQNGIKGVLWRITDVIDGIRNERAWVQMAFQLEE